MNTTVERKRLTPKQILAIRKKLGWSQTRLAEEMGVTHGAISQWERGLTTPTGPAERLLRIFADSC